MINKFKTYRPEIVILTLISDYSANGVFNRLWVSNRETMSQFQQGQFSSSAKVHIHSKVHLASSSMLIGNDFPEVKTLVA
jgi:hypothetical protein